MSEELEHLKRKVAEAYEAKWKFQYEVIEPRFYKEKKGRKTEYINPWTSMKERIDAEAKHKELWDQWHVLYNEYIKRTGEIPPCPLLYIEVQTPDGIRFKRVEQAS